MQDEDRFCDLPSGMRICHRVHGHAGGEPLLLIAGLGLQLHYWTPLFVGSLVERGFRVIVFDNRDVGRSSRGKGRPPGVLRQLFKRIEKSAYDLDDMADDAAGLLAHLGVARAHVVGMSMGGMIAQTLAVRHAPRVASLTSIFSTTGHGRVGQPALSSLLKLSKPPVRSRDAAMARYVEVMHHVGSTAYAMHERDLRAYAGTAWDRGDGPTAHAGMARQIGAIFKSGDRTAQLRRITAPTLVLHGERDLLVAPSGGAATAAAIPGARLLTVHGMGHNIPDEAAPFLVDLIDGHARRAAEPAIPMGRAPSRAA